MSRTATAKWKNLRRRALHRAQTQGITHCPCKDACKHHHGHTCNVPLDYTNGMRPNSATPDHIHHHALGGKDSLENTTTVCRRCNSADGGRLGRTIQQQHTPQRVPTIDFTQGA